MEGDVGTGELGAKTESMGRDKALGILNADRDTRLSGDAIDALAACTAA